MKKLKTRLLSAQDILSAKDIKYVEVEVPEWGGVVRIKTLSGEEAAMFLLDEFQKDKKNAAVRVLCASIVNEDGSPMFTEADLAELRKRSLVAINRLQEAALKLNGLKVDKEDAVKNA